MRYRVTDYKITVNEGFVLVSIPATDEQVLEGATTRPLREAIRLIVDETAAVVFCSSMQKSNILSCSPSLYEGYWSIQFAIPAGKTITADDQFTIEMDWGTDMDSALQQLETNLKDYMGVTSEDETGEYQALTVSEVRTACHDIWQTVWGEVKHTTDTPIDINGNIINNE